MAHIIAIANQKGGVAKTTTAINVGAILADMGHKVLLVDNDPQCNLSISCGIKIVGPEMHLYHAYIGVCELEDVIRSYKTNLDVVPTNIVLGGTETMLHNEIGKEQILKQILETVSSKYNFILIDCPPTFGFLPNSALVAANYVVIPMSSDVLAILGTSQLIDIISKVKQRLNPHLKVLGISVNQYFKNTLHSKEALAYLRQMTQDDIPIFNTIIHHSTKLKDAIANNIPIIEFDPEHNSAKEYRSLTEEIYDQTKA